MPPNCATTLATIVAMPVSSATSASYTVAAPPAARISLAASSATAPSMSTSHGVRATGCERVPERLAEPPAPTGDDRHPAGELLIVHRVSLARFELCQTHLEPSDEMLNASRPVFEMCLTQLERMRRGTILCTMNRSRPTVADIRAAKGTRQLAMVYTEFPEEARAAAEAGIDILSIPTPFWNPAMREAAGDCFVQAGLLYGYLATTDDYLRAAHDAMVIGADCVYCAASTQVIERLAAEGIPVVGHVGLIPSRRTWTGGFKAVGKTLESAKLVYRQVKELESAGAFAAEIEVVPADDRDRDREAHLAGADVDGRRHGVRRPVPVLVRRARLHRRPRAAARQAVPRLRCRVRPAAPRAGRCVQRVHRRRRERRVPAAGAPRVGRPDRAGAVRGVPGHRRVTPARAVNAPG